MNKIIRKTHYRLCRFKRGIFSTIAFFAVACFFGSVAFADPTTDQYTFIPDTPSIARSKAEINTINDTVAGLLQQKFNPLTMQASTPPPLPAPVTIADRSNEQIPSLPSPPVAVPAEPRTEAVSSSGGTSNLTTVPTPEAAPRPAAVVADITPSAKEEIKGEAPTAMASLATPGATHAWETQLQTLEQENQSLRQKLHMSVNDPLRDIEVDAVAKIHEDVLRARITELEKEIDKLNMKNDEVLPQKTKPDSPAVPPAKSPHGI